MPHPAALKAVPLGGWADPEALFLALFAASDAAFWLDGGPSAEEGWSILGDGEVEDDPDAVRNTKLSGARSHADPVPFHGGWVGWIAYEDGAAAAGAPVARPEGGSAWIATRRAIAIDHGTRRVWALADAASIDRWAAQVTTALAHAVPAAEVPVPEPAPERTVAVARHTVAEYVSMIEECRRAIHDGDAYQLCLTTRFTVPLRQDPLSAYRRLRTSTPAHHGGYLRIGGRVLLSASPEQFLSVSEGRATTSPIKGTRPRGEDAASDAALAAELRTDVKERAENVMIVDLMRNDLSRVGVPGSLRVERLWEVETYPAVHQLVSTVSVRLREGVRFGELGDATFPAGSMTGAPKLSAMTVLHGLEQAPRGVYSGCFGFVGVDGVVDLAMVIRSIVAESGYAHVGAGGGITWLSRPDAETAEVATKARAPLAALAASLPADWASLLPRAPRAEPGSDTR